MQTLQDLIDKWTQERHKCNRAWHGGHRAAFDHCIQDLEDHLKAVSPFQVRCDEKAERASNAQMACYIPDSQATAFSGLDRAIQGYEETMIKKFGELKAQAAKLMGEKPTCASVAWKPIESAPRDGRTVVVATQLTTHQPPFSLSNRQDSFFPRLAVWSDSCQNWIDPAHKAAVFAFPTHWLVAIPNRS